MGAADLDWMGWVVIITVVIALLIMAADLVGPDLVFSVLLAFYLACGILTVSKASANYGNSGLLTVVMLYLVAEGIYQTGALEGVMVYILGNSRSPYWANVRMMLPTMALSAFLNNTPVVSLLTPVLISWSRRTGVPAKKVLIPLSYASVLGGTCTLIGSSTNLVVSGAQTSRYERLKQLEYTKFNIFDIAPYGVPYALWGFLFVVVAQRWLLPGNASKFARNILMGLRVPPTSPTNGRTILECGLHKLHGSHLVGLLRNGIFTPKPSPKTTLKENDIVYFGGEVDSVIFYAEDNGLTLTNHETEEHPTEVELSGVTSASFNKIMQVTVSEGSDLVGQAVSSAKFKSRFDLAVLGIKRGRAGRVDSCIRDVVLEAGDILVVDAGLGNDVQGKDFTTQFTEVHELKTSLSKEFVVAYVAGSGLNGKTVGTAGLRGIPGLTIIAVDPHSERDQRMEPVPHEYALQTGDTVWVLADVEGIVFLNKFPGMSLAEQPQIERTGVDILYRKLTHAVVSKHSSLNGKTVVDSNFRRKYKAALVGVNREDLRTPVSAKNVVIQPGDMLLLMTGEDFEKEYKFDRNFVLINDIPSSSPPKKSRGPIAVFLGVVMILTQIIPGVQNKDEWIHLWPCSVLTAGLMLLTGCLSGDDARRSILWDVYLCIAAAFGVSNAMEGTGVANEFAQVFITIARKIGTEGAGLTAIYIATALLSEILTNNAAGAIMYPIAAVAGDALGITPRKMSTAIMLGASAGFINPFSYQCNLMVYAAGNYKTLEFAKIGAPFQVYLLIVSSFILHFMDDWHTVWIVSWVAVAAFVLIPAGWAYAPPHWTLPIEEGLQRFGARVKGVFRGSWRRNGAAFGRSDSDDDLQRVQNSDISVDGSDPKADKPHVFTQMAASPSS